MTGSEDHDGGSWRLPRRRGSGRTGRKCVAGSRARGARRATPARLGIENESAQGRDASALRRSRDKGGDTAPRLLRFRADCAGFPQTGRLSLCCQVRPSLVFKSIGGAVARHGPCSRSCRRRPLVFGGGRCDGSKGVADVRESNRNAQFSEGRVASIRAANSACRKVRHRVDPQAHIGIHDNRGT